jgi:indole-3-glycerol phosphate synthase
VKPRPYDVVVLPHIIADVRRDLPSLRKRASELREAALRQEPARDFLGALSEPGLSVIAELKRASPSRGLIDPDLNPAKLAREYEGGGAAALSVLTEPRHFLGSLDDLRRARAAVDVPVLRKDFLLDPVQVWEARAAGADAVLLIVAALDDETLADLLTETRLTGMEAMVEVHTAPEVERARSTGAQIIGVNNRDLGTFEVDLVTCETLAPLLGSEVVAVAESGIWTAADARRVRTAGYDAILVGESLVRADDPGALLADLRENGLPA